MTTAEKIHLVTSKIAELDKAIAELNQRLADLRRTNLAKLAPVKWKTKAWHWMLFIVTALATLWLLATHGTVVELHDLADGF